MANWSFHEGELGRDDVRALLARHFAAMRAASPRDACHVLDLAGLDRPEVRLVSLRAADGALVGIGALRALEPGHGELKSMRVADEARGTGAGRALLEHLTALARAAGMTRLSLETGNGPPFEPALKLYASAGFAPCPPFAGYAPTPFTVFLSRPL